MRGSPLLRAFIALLILLSLGLPMRHFLQADQSAPPPAPATPSPATAMQKLHVQVSFTIPPGKFSVLSLGQEVWNESAPTPEMAHELTLAYPKEGVDLQFDLAWPEGTRAAARIRLTDPEGTDHDKYIWGEGTTSEVLTFP